MIPTVRRGSTGSTHHGLLGLLVIWLLNLVNAKVLLNGMGPMSVIILMLRCTLNLLVKSRCKTERFRSG
eukprot:4689859-Karenia_brevis.AAC.1